MDELLALAERCEAASGSTIGLNHEIGRALAGPSGNYEYRDYTASLDAALTLVPERLCWRLGVNGNPKAKLLGGSAAQILGNDFGTDITKAGAATPALALCAAALRARAHSKEE